jgi:hypothetical protein
MRSCFFLGAVQTQSQELQVKDYQLEASCFSEENTMPTKKRAIRAWTATDVRTLKGLAKQKVGVQKISRKLKRTIPAVTMHASKLGISLSTR